VAGFGLRIRHLGRLGLIGDEGIQAVAVQHILATGVPRVDSGILYTRSLPYLYTQAACARSFGLNEFSLRLPSLFFGVLAIWLMYLFGRRVIDWRIGLSAAAVMAFSVWEIELSRYGRFYTLFQSSYLLSLLLFYRGFLEGDRRARWWWIPAALVTIASHELGAVILSCFLIPVIFRLVRPAGGAIRWWLIWTGLVGAAVAYAGFLAACRTGEQWIWPRLPGVSHPHVYGYIVSWLRQGWPVMLGALAAGSLLLIRRMIVDRSRPAAFLLGALALPIFIASCVEVRMYQPRYFFHLYPLIVLVCVIAAASGGKALVARWPTRFGLLRRAAIAGLFLAALVLSQDANPLAAWAVGNQTYQSRRDLFARLRGPLTSSHEGVIHQDFKHPSRYVREHRAAGDMVIALGLPHKVAIYHYYAGGVDRSVEEKPRFYQLRRADGTIIEHITGNVVLEGYPALQTFLASHSGRVWILADRLLIRPDHYLYSDPLKTFLAPLAEHPAEVGEDGLTFAALLPSKSAPAGQ